MWVADIDEDIDCIIGYDFMNCIDVTNSTMTVNKEQKFCAILNTQDVRCCLVAAPEITVIPPCVEQILRCV